MHRLLLGLRGATFKGGKLLSDPTNTRSRLKIFIHRS